MPEGALGLPELARSLRALGTARGIAAESAHAAVFGPLLDARARAAAGDPDGVFAAFRGQALAARIAARASEAARTTESDAARGRARVARAREALEPLRDALHLLDALVPPVPSDAAAPSTSDMAAWTAQIVRVFRLADDACLELARVLDDRDLDAPRRGWFGRFGR